MLVAAVGLVACGSRGTPRASEAPGTPVLVRTVAAVRSAGPGEVAVPGTVQARMRAVLSARIVASVVALPYDEGESVAAGAVVVRLADAALRAAGAAADAGARAAESDLERTRTLLAKGAATPRELEQTTAVAIAARAQLTAARDSLAYSALRAPFAGRLAARRVNVGDVVSPGLPLVEIEGGDGLELRATVDSTIAATLRPGARMRAVVDGQPVPVAATVTAVAPSGDATTHRFDLKAHLPPVPELRAGLFARLLVPGLQAEARVVVPATAVFERGGLTGLFVVRDGRARLVWVALGAPGEGGIEIRAGLEAGERVVLDPQGLRDGSAVVEPRE